MWEFPGGKVEPDEDVRTALGRELEEELGIRVTRAMPLIRIPHAYPDRRVLLDVWRVMAFDNEAYGAEGQAIRWVERDSLYNYAFPAANRPIVTAASLPSRYLITPEPGQRNEWPDFLARLESCMVKGLRLIQFRGKNLSRDDYCDLAGEVLTLGRDRKVTIMLNTSPDIALALNTNGLHLSSSWLHKLQQRPVAQHTLLSASCHNLNELRKATAIGVDFAVLSPVKPTTSHPEQKGIGWDTFHALAEQSIVPLYALGGMSEDDIETAWMHGGRGVAAISALWQRGCMRREE